MVNAIQKIALILGFLVLCGLSNFVFAAKINKCSTAAIIVTKKQVGTATYYAENCGKNWQNQDIQLDFAYTHDIPEWAFKRAATYFLKKNVSNFNDASLLNQITQLYKPVKNGDNYRLSYSHLSHTLRLSLNQKQLGYIQDDQAQQYFTIWLGSQPFNAKLKQQLLN